MENVLLIVHLLLALALIGVVLLQRSEGGGLGIGGGGGVMTGRQAATAMTKVTWGLAVAFLVTSIALTVVAGANASGGSVVDRLTEEEGAEGSLLPPGDALLPPSQDAPLSPPRAD